MPRPTPPGPRARIVQAMREGDDAARAGKQSTECPYDAGRAPLRRQAWTAGYGRARRALNPARTPSAWAESSNPDDPAPA